MNNLQAENIYNLVPLTLPISDDVSGSTNYDDTDLKNRVTQVETNKVDKVAGKGLSTEDFTTAEKSKLAGLTGDSSGGTAYDDTALQSRVTQVEATKVDKEPGKQLTEAIFTAAEKSKLAGLTVGGSAQAEDKSLRFAFGVGHQNMVQVTITAENAGVYSSDSLDNISLVEYKVNGFEDTLPSFLIAGDVLTATITRIDANQAAGLTVTTIKSFNYSSAPIVVVVPDELLVNSGFDDQTAWNLGGNWSISGGNAILSGGDGRMYQSVNLSANTTYDIVIQASGIQDGGIFFEFANPENFNGFSYLKLNSGSNTIQYTPTQDVTRYFSIVGNQGGGTISSASLKVAGSTPPPQSYNGTYYPEYYPETY